MAFETSKVHLIVFSHSAIFMGRLPKNDIESSRINEEQKETTKNDQKLNLLIHYGDLLYKTTKKISQIPLPKQKYNPKNMYSFPGAFRC